MKLIGLQSWYDEPVEFLERSLRDAHACGVTHWVALDGRYAAVDGPAHSNPEQAQHIRNVCEELGIPCNVIINKRPWPSESAKRTRLFQHGYKFNPTTQDWFFVQDADQHIPKPVDIRGWLATREGDVCETLFIENDDKRWNKDTRRRFGRQLFRCNPGLHVDPANHWTYRDQTGRILWGFNAIKPAGLAPFYILNDSRGRSTQRQDLRDEYYTRREEQKLERYLRTTCMKCGEPWHYKFAIDFRVQRLPDETIQLTSGTTGYYCAEHAQPEMERNARRARWLAQGDPKAERAIADIMIGTCARNPAIYGTYAMPDAPDTQGGVVAGATVG